MPTRPDRSLPTPGGDLFLTDGGLETTLIFHDGVDLPDFAAFPLLGDEAGRDALTRYFDSYVRIAAEAGLPLVLETPTWRGSLDWATRLGWDAAALRAANQDAVRFVASFADRLDQPLVTSGCVGPRGDGYVVDQAMSADEAAAYHAPQVQAFAEAGADVATAITMTYAAEAVGVARTAQAAGLPVVVSFTVETDGRLPSGQGLGDAITEVDAATGGYPAYFMVNCAHPTHFEHVLDPQQDWTRRLGGLRANASTMSHAELDEAEDLDAGDPVDLAQRYRGLREALPWVSVAGGCCGTDTRHVRAMAEALTG